MDLLINKYQYFEIKLFVKCIKLEKIKGYVSPSPLPPIVSLQPTYPQMISPISLLNY